jgi:predicted nucleic acid-binding protein
MLVIADSSPLIALVNIRQVNVLPKLFGDVTIPRLVADELASARRPQAVRDFIASTPSWLHLRSPSVIESIPLLQPAESAAISLARELNADLLLIDEVQGRKAAAARKLKITGTIGILELAASAKLLDLQEAFDRLKQTDFWISHKLLDERLALFRSTNARQP